MGQPTHRGQIDLKAKPKRTDEEVRDFIEACANALMERIAVRTGRAEPINREPYGHEKHKKLRPDS